MREFGATTGTIARKSQLERHRLKYERETRHHFDELLQKMHQASQEARARLDEHHAADLQKKTQEIEAAREQKLLAIGQVKRRLEAFAADQNESMREFENQIAVRFSETEADLARRHEMERAKAGEEEITRWERRMQLERERELAVESSQAEYEDAIRAKFDVMLRRKQEETNRGKICP